VLPVVSQADHKPPCHQRRQASVVLTTARRPPGGQRYRIRQRSEGLSAGLGPEQRPGRRRGDVQSVTECDEVAWRPSRLQGGSGCVKEAFPPPPLPSLLCGGFGEWPFGPFRSDPCTLALPHPRNAGAAMSNRTPRASMRGHLARGRGPVSGAVRYLYKMSGLRNGARARKQNELKGLEDILAAD